MGRKRHEEEAAGKPELDEKTPTEAADDAAESELDALRAERDDWKDRYHRALADAENARKRHLREQKDSRHYAISEFARELLSVLDNLERALDGVPEDQADDALVTGVRLVFDQFQKTLESHGVESIDALGQPFDPMHHEVIQEEERDDVAPGTIIDELMKGYKVKDRLLRASVVRVAKGKAAAGGGGSASNSEDQPSREE